MEDRQLNELTSKITCNSDKCSQVQVHDALGACTRGSDPVKGTRGGFHLKVIIELNLEDAQAWNDVVDALGPCPDPLLQD